MPRGRPSKGERTPVVVRFPPAILAPIERLSLTTGRERHDIILELIEKGLKCP